MSTLSTFVERSLYSVPFSINGKDYHPEHSFAVISPATEKPIHNCGSATVPDADFAVAAAAEAFKAWRKTTPACRRNILFKAAEAIERRREELIQYMTDETGATMAWCHFNLDAAIEMIKDVAGRVATLEGSCPATMDPDTTGIVMREPYGVVLSIAPWNAPYILGTRAVVFPSAG